MDEKRILLDGFHVNFDSRILFMKELFCYPKIREEVMVRLFREGELEEWKKGERLVVGGHIAHIEMEEKDLITLFEKLTRHGELERLQAESKATQYLRELLKRGNTDIEVNLDGVLLIAYGIVTVQGCREELERTFCEPEKYFAKFLDSQYRECDMGACIPAEYVWTMRLIIGILLELREKRERILYQKMMRVICCGYKVLKKDIKRYSHMTGVRLKEINGSSKNIKPDAMQMSAQILITLILMEELQVEMLWDFSSGILLPFMELYEEELLQGYLVQTIDEKVEAKQAEWKEKFAETYGTNLSLRELLLENRDDSNADAMMQVMSLFGINSRKFGNYELTEQEHRLILAQKEKWNSKIYWSTIIIAQLCKYIQQLEKRFLSESSQAWNIKNWMVEDKRATELKELEAMRCKVEKMEQALLEHEQTEKQLQKQVKISESKLKASREENSNLKAYIDYSSQEHPKEHEASNKNINAFGWADKQVLVLGGHPSWQHKLRSYFPKWQFLVAEQKGQLREAIKGKEYIICNVNMLSHACYYKLLSCKEVGQKILYVQHTNIEQGLLELEKQL